MQADNLACALDEAWSLTYVSEGIVQATDHRREEFLRSGGVTIRSLIRRGDLPRVQATIDAADRVGLGVGRMVEAGLIQLAWRSPIERLLDEVGHETLVTVRRP